MTATKLVRLRDPATEARRWRLRHVPFDPARHDTLSRDTREPWMDAADGDDGGDASVRALDLMRKAAHFDARLPGAIQLRADGWSQERIARRLGVTQPALCRLLSRFRASV
jgi:hypothetical protein